MACVEKRGNGYRITVYGGYDSTGKQVKYRKSWDPAPGMTEHQIKKELERQKVLFEEESKKGRIVNGTIKFKDFTEKWFDEYAASNLRATTLENYRSLSVRTYEAIGHIRLDRITPSDLNKFYISLRGIKPGRASSYRLKIDLKSILQDKGLTYSEFAKESSLALSTIKSVATDHNVSNVTAQKISQTLNISLDTIFESAHGENAKLASKTVKHYHSFISSVLERAVKWGYILDNPCRRVDPPKIERKKISCLSQEEAKLFLKGLSTEPLESQAIFYTLLFTGLRRGELLGLEWSDINFEEKTLTVQRSSLYTHVNGTFTDTTKNESSKRTIAISDELIYTLKRYKEEQTTLKNTAGDLWTDSDRLFVKWNGQPMSTNKPYKLLQKLLEKYDLPKVSLHSLRHTNATIMIMSGVDLNTTSERLGHSQTSTTMNIYVHHIKSANEKAAENISRALSFA